MKKNEITEINISTACPPEKPFSEYVSYQEELSLSNPGQIELLLGICERGVPLRTAVRGFSMHPFIRDGDIVTIAPLPFGSPRTGEVVAFTNSGRNRLAIHRIIKKVEAGFILRGDNCQEADGLIAAEDIIGRVTLIERNGRELFFGLKSGLSTRLITWLSRHNLLLLVITLISAPVRMVRSMGKI